MILNVKNREPNDELISLNSNYRFYKSSQFWILDKNIKLNINLILEHLNVVYHEQFLNTLACFATTRSSSYTKKMFYGFYDYIKNTTDGLITDDTIKNYHDKSIVNKPDHINSMRAFFSKWVKLGLEGVTRYQVEILYLGRVKQRHIGEFVSGRDLTKGPLSESDIINFNEGAMWLYSEDEITLDQLTMSLLTSYTGRRPIQTSHLKLKDFSKLFCDDKDDYVINYPRAKHRGAFRTEFTKLKIIEDLHDLILLLVTENIKFFESLLCRTISDEEMEEIPLFIDYPTLINNGRNDDFLSVIKSDFFHVKSRVITRTIKKVSRKLNSLQYAENINARRFRYALGTRAAQEGYGEYVIAELLDHRTTKCVGCYVENVPEYGKKIDEVMTSEMKIYASAFKGEVINTDLGFQKIKNHKGVNSGNCSNCSDCNAPIPIPCYTCIYFKPWVDAPHQDVYDYLIHERERIAGITEDMKVSSALDRTISAVNEVINKCKFIKYKGVDHE
jgi:hypothetical protein